MEKNRENKKLCLTKREIVIYTYKSLAADIILNKKYYYFLNYNDYLSSIMRYKAFILYKINNDNEFIRNGLTIRWNKI